MNAHGTDTTGSSSLDRDVLQRLTQTWRLLDDAAAKVELEFKNFEQGPLAPEAHLALRRATTAWAEANRAFEELRTALNNRVKGSKPI